MPTYEHHNKAVADVLRDNGFSVLHNLAITTEPINHGRVVTTIRNSNPADRPWTAAGAANLAHAAGQLPGADVRLRPIVDRVVVVWDGV